MTKEEKFEQGLEALRALKRLAVREEIISTLELELLTDDQLIEIAKVVLIRQEERELVAGFSCKLALLKKPVKRLKQTLYMKEMYRKSLIQVLEKEFLRADVQEMRELYPEFFKFLKPSQLGETHG